MTQREKFLAAARSFVGSSELDGTHREIIDLYNSIRPLPEGYKMSYKDPWCAAYVSAAGELAGLTGIVLPECSCQRMISKYKKIGRCSSLLPENLRPGDLVMYDWERDGAADHVGIVAEVGDKLRVLEGNMANAVGYRLIAPDSKNIRCFCLPLFDDEAGETPAEPEESPAEEKIQLSLPQLSRGSSGETVRAAQILLIGRGSRCGPWGADGEFGDGTYGAVLRYQQLRGLESDGVIGPITWRALLGV